jgi:hypothetical protein
MKKLYLFLYAFFFFTFIVNAQTDEKLPDRKGSSGWGIAAKGSTLGYGFELSHALSSKFIIRASWNELTFKDTYTVDDPDVDVDVDMKIGGPSLMLDYYITRKIHLSGGVLYNQLDGNATAYPLEEYTFGEIILSPEKVGNATLTVEPGTKLSPYLGIGFGRSLALNHRLAFSFELGAFYQGKPKATITANGMLEPSGSEEQNDQLNDNLSSYQLYPFLSFMLSYKFLK